MLQNKLAFNRAIMIDFQGSKITSDVGLRLLSEIDARGKGFPKTVFGRNGQASVIIS
jgi:hypothetical protein